MDVEVNYLESKDWDEQEMRERFRWLRENDPVFWSEKDQQSWFSNQFFYFFCQVSTLKNWILFLVPP